MKTLIKRIISYDSLCAHLYDYVFYDFGLIIKCILSVGFDPDSLWNANSTETCRLCSPLI
jgi:hypothetical protein